MNEIIKRMRLANHRLLLLVLLCLYVAICCVSLYFVVYYYRGYQFIHYEPGRLHSALWNVAPLAPLALIFVFARFSFGYFIGFSLYTLVLGYVFFASWSGQSYDHSLGRISAGASIIAFLLPALFITTPVRQWITLSHTVLQRGLLLILILAAVLIAVGASYNFRIVGLSDMYDYRNQLKFPGVLNYATGIFINALLPFAFACYHMLRKRWHAATALVFLLLFYPVTLTKLTLFAPVWLAFLALLARFFEIRVATVLSLLLLVGIGDLLVPLEASGALSYDHFISYFGLVNFRLVAVPSIALDVYSDYFSKNSLTHFCQIGMLKPFVQCPYHEYLSIILSRSYPLGFINASLFATEGIASVGPKFAPLVAFGCGLVIAISNGLSSRLPPAFILLSGGMLSQIFLNVPMATTLLSYGAAPLFLLWYITPRDLFEQPAPAQPAARNT